MTSSSSKAKRDPAAQWIEKNLKGASYVVRFGVTATDDLSDEDLRQHFNGLNEAKLQFLFTLPMSLVVAKLFLQFCTRDFPDEFLERYFGDMQFVNMYCAQGHELRSWMYDRGTESVLAVLLANKSAFSNEEARIIAKRWKEKQQPFEPEYVCAAKLVCCLLILMFVWMFFSVLNIEMRLNKLELGTPVPPPKRMVLFECIEEFWEWFCILLYVFSGGLIKLHSTL